MRKLIKESASLLLGLSLAATAVADVSLTIRSSGAALTSTPTVVSAGEVQCCEVKKNNVIGGWTTNLLPSSDQFITSFKISSNDASVVAIRLDLPSSLESQAQSVVLRRPNVLDASSRTVFNYWVNKKPHLDSLSDVMGYLQDLHFIVTKQRDANTNTDTSASRVKAAYMLLQTVQRLGTETWYIVHPEYQDSINFAANILSRSINEEKHCRWLGSGACLTAAKLLSNIKLLPGVRMSRIYDLIVPKDKQNSTDGTALNSSFCTRNKVTELNAFYDYFSTQADVLAATNLRKGSGNSEIRIANVIAACSVALVSCGDLTDLEDKEKILTHALDILASAERQFKDSSSNSIGRRRIEVNAKLNATIAGLPISCEN